MAIFFVPGAIDFLNDAASRFSFFAAEGEEQPLTTEQVQAAEEGQAAIQKATSLQSDYNGSAADFVFSIFFPGFGSIFQSALNGASKNEVVGQLVPLISQAQDYAKENNIESKGEAPPPSPDQAQNPVDAAIAQATQFTQTLVA